MMILQIITRIQGLEPLSTALMERMSIKEFPRSFAFLRFPLILSKGIYLLGWDFFVWQDYTGDDVTVDNLFAVILGDKTAIKGGSGKVVNSGPNDHIFIFYSDHGGPGVLGEFS